MRPEVVVWAVLVLWASEVAADHCDWTGSGLTLPSRGVTPVYLRCRSGSVRWRYPRGALRLLFRPPLPAAGDFRLCLRVVRRPDPPGLFHQLNETESEPTPFPARVFVEGKSRLLPLYAAGDGDPREVRCVRAREGRLALYIEAEAESSATTRREAVLQYEARPLPRRHYDPASADCRPCSDEEMELAFCTSDLVSRGVIVGSAHRAELDATRLTLRLTKLLRATAPSAPDDEPSDEEDDEYYRYETDNSLSTYAQPARRRARSLHAHVHVAASCGASAGAGEFLVMARRRFGRYSLVCAPRVQDWIELVERRNAEGVAHCELQH